MKLERNEASTAPTGPLARVTGVALRFVPNRTQVRRVTLTFGEREFLLRPPGDASLETLRSGRSRWVFVGLTEFEEFGGLTGPVAIRVHSIGEPPILGEVLWRMRDEDLEAPQAVGADPSATEFGGVILADEGEPSLERLAEAFAQRDVPSMYLTEDQFDSRVATFDPDPKELHERRVQGLEDRHQVELFFTELDRRTTVADPEALKMQALVSGRLRQRLDVRQALAAQERPKALRFAPINPGTYLRKYLKPLAGVSGMLIELAQEYLLGRRSYDLFDWAFEQFVTDEVVCSHYLRDCHATVAAQGAPDSLLFLRLPELGFCLYENGIDAEFWSTHLPTLVRASQISLEHSVATEGLPEQVYPAPEDRFRFVRGRKYPEERRTHLRQEYAELLDGLDVAQRMEALEERFGALIGAALGENRLRVSGQRTREIPGRSRAELFAKGVGGQPGRLTSLVPATAPTPAGGTVRDPGSGGPVRDLVAGV